MTPYRGTTRENEGVIVGFAISPRRRWRLDFSDQPGPNAEPAKWVHVNEEDFDAAAGSQRIVHRVESRNFVLVSLQYQKWRARVRPGAPTEMTGCLVPVSSLPCRQRFGARREGMEHRLVPHRRQTLRHFLRLD